MAEKIKMAAKHKFSIFPVKFDANQLKLWIWRERYIKKISLKNFFFKTSKWQIKWRWRHQPMFFPFGFHTAISQPIST
jgi:hypothetical protein